MAFNYFDLIRKWKANEENVVAKGSKRCTINIIKFENYL